MIILTDGWILPIGGVSALDGLLLKGFGDTSKMIAVSVLEPSHSHEPSLVLFYEATTFPSFC